MKKIITIKNEKDYKIFLNKLIFYKTFLYRNVDFELESDLDNYFIEFIIEALNIKKREDRIAFVYDIACDYIDEEMKNINICDFKNNRCFIQRKCNSDKNNGCCHSCIYQVNKRCTTKNISCKLFFCPSGRKKSKSIIKVKDIDILRLYSIRQRMIIRVDFYTSREEVLKDLKSYLFFNSIMNALNRDNY